MFRIILVFLICAPALSQTLEEEYRIKQLCQWIKEQQVRYEIPGLAFALVKGDETLVVKTLGYSNKEKKTAVTKDTVFAIGSCAKPFTSALCALLVTDGFMAWDDPVTKYLPEFKLKIKTENPKDRVTIRDLLSHRTGFFTMELIQDAMNWGQDPEWDKKEKLSRTSLLKKAVQCEPKDPFRKKHNYSNISMLAAAMASEKAVGVKWDDLIKEHLFTPLGMTHASTSITRIKKDHHTATGYLKMNKRMTPAMAINMDVIAPAGGINASISDMTHWMRMLLCDGAFEGEPIIGKKALQETWKEQISNADVGGAFPGAGYGLGWFIRTWENLRVIEHGGNALGFSAMTALIPEKKLGFVMLSNCIPNPLQDTLGPKVWEIMLKGS